MNRTVFTINFIWLPLAWEHKKDAGSRTVCWLHAPRVGDRLRLLLSRKVREEVKDDPDPIAVRVDFTVERVTWAPDGLATTTAEVLLRPTGEVVDVPINEIAEQIAARRRSDAIRSVANQIFAGVGRREHPFLDPLINGIYDRGNAAEPVDDDDALADASAAAAMAAASETES